MNNISYLGTINKARHNTFNQYLNNYISKKGQTKVRLKQMLTLDVRICVLTETSDSSYNVLNPGSFVKRKHNVVGCCNQMLP